MPNITRVLLMAFVFIFFLGLLGSVGAQGNERGIIYGHVLGEPELQQGITVEVARLPTGSPHTTLTGSEGLYRFEDLVPGSYKIEFKRSGYAPIPYEFELGTEELEIRAIIFDNSIGVAGTITGLVVDERGQILVKNVKIKLTGVDGKFELVEEEPPYTFGLNAPLGTYILTVEHPDYERWSKQITLKDHEGFDLGKIALSKPGFIAMNPLLIGAIAVLVIVTVVFILHRKAKRGYEEFPPPAPQPPSEPQEPGPAT